MHNCCAVKFVIVIISSKQFICHLKEESYNGNTYYVMTPIDDESLIIDIPTENKTGFLRSIISTEDAKKLVEKIPTIEPLKNINEKNLEVQYKDMLNTCNHENLIKIIKTTYLRNEDRVNSKKRMSEKDSTYFKLAEKYLYNELAISLNMTVDEVKDYIFEIVNK